MKRKVIDCMTIASLVLLFCMGTYAQAAEKKGGVGPFLGSCCLGPRIGLEMNEGVSVKTMEIVQIAPYIGGLARIYLSYDYGYKAAGAKGFLASCCIGPRVGKELPERKVRSKELMSLIPVIGIIPRVMIAIEAAQGKTMNEIERKEGLKR
jgi:hypothetical protein